MFTRSVVALVLAMSLSSCAYAQIIHVPGDYRTIQQAIDAAKHGDEIIVAPDTYFENINLLGKAVTLRSSDGPGVTIIDGQGDGSAVTVTDVEEPGAVIEGFTITGGDLTGGVYVVDSTATIASCVIKDNTAFEGGGAFVERSTLTVTNTVFDGNAAAFGGAMHNMESTVHIADSVMINGFTNHWAAALLNIDSTVTITGSQISHNFSRKMDGAISNYSTSTLTILDSVITHNELGWGGGGGIYNSGTLQVGGTFFCRNTPDDLYQHPTSGSWDDLGGNTFSPAADLNCDGVVDVDDLFILLAAWGECDDPDDCPADLDDDGVVDVDDLFILLANWG